MDTPPPLAIVPTVKTSTKGNGMAGISDGVAQGLVLRHAMEMLWARYARDRFDDPLAGIAEIANGARDDIEKMYTVSHATDREHLHVSLQRILHHEGEFWDSVADRLRRE